MNLSRQQIIIAAIVLIAIACLAIFLIFIAPPARLAPLKGATPWTSTPMPVTSTPTASFTISPTPTATTRSITASPTPTVTPTSSNTPQPTETPTPIVMLPTTGGTPLDSARVIFVGFAMLSGFLTYVPGLRVWWARLDGDVKRLFMLVSIGVVSIAVVALSCGEFADWIICERTDILNFILSVAANAMAGVAGSQGTYLLSPLPSDVKSIVELK